MMVQGSKARTDAANGRGETGPSDVARERSPESQRVSLWEWVVAALGLILVVGVIGFLLSRAFTEAGTPPAVEFSVDAVEPAGAGYLVTFTAANRGDEAAAALLVEGQLTGDDGGTETSTATLSYLPGGSQRHGGLYFTADPRVRRLLIQAKGYERP